MKPNQKPEPGSPAWAQDELAIAQERLRRVRELIPAAADRELPALLRLEAHLRRECERLARLAQPDDLAGLAGDADSLSAALGLESDDGSEA
ncbi:MAG: hypothetical protein N2036_03225 [Bryobacteraceae bacterium]|nr:hypothetical protein [Bryobacteraceae bacterium]